MQVSEHMNTTSTTLYGFAGTQVRPTSFDAKEILRDPALRAQHAELARKIELAATGTVIAMTDADQTVLLNTIALDLRSADVARQVRRAHDERLSLSGGRRLLRLFAHAGLRDVRIEFCTVAATDYALARQMSSIDADEAYTLERGWVTEDDVRYLRAMCERASDCCMFYGHISLATVSGTKL